MAKRHWLFFIKHSNLDIWQGSEYASVVCFSSRTLTTISNTRKFAKMVHPDFLGEDGRWKDHCDSENWWLQVLVSDEDTCNQNGKPFILPFPYPQLFIITFIAYMQPLPMHHPQNTVSPTVYTQTIEKVYHKAYNKLNLNVDHSGGISETYQNGTELFDATMDFYWVSI